MLADLRPYLNCLATGIIMFLVFYVMVGGCNK